jgi:colanic acid/amylovoran biosynthesis glycosyltransferase
MKNKKQKMNKKIVYITSSFPFGKSEVWANNEINSLLEQGNEIIIIPRTGKGKIINKDSIKFTSNLIDLPFMNWTIFIFLLRTVLFKTFLFLKLLIEIIKQSNTIIDFVKGLIILPKSLFLAKILKLRKIDHIHSLQTTSTAVMAFILSSNLKVPWSYTLHTSETLKARFKRSILFQSRSASVCRTISQRTANELSDFIGPSLSKKIAMVHLGVDIKGFKKGKSIITDPLIIATPAELKDRKGHVYAIEAAKKLIDLGITNFKWFFYGSGPLLNELQKKVKELNLINHCYFPGNLAHHLLLNKYENNEVDIVVISSISTDIPEGIPVSLMEAMSYEIPVIATDCGGTKELVDGQSGVLVNQNDSEVIANAIFKLIDKPEYRRKIGKNGRNKIKQDFDTMKNAHDLIKLF